MSKFLDLIQKKNEMLKVTMKVDPAACKNGEITHFKEYVGFVLAEKEFEKTYEKLLKHYTLQNEGFFDTVKAAGTAVLNKIKSDIVSPFTDPKFNPFVGQEKDVQKDQRRLYDSNQVIEKIEKKYFVSNKPIDFNFGTLGSATLTYNQLIYRISRNRNISQLFINNDLNTQIKVRNLEKTFIPYITKEIEEISRKSKTKIDVKPNQIWKELVKYVEGIFKDNRPRNSVLSKKIVWIYILAKNNQKVVLS